MTEWKLFGDGTVPECTTAAWYETRERAPHLEEPHHRGRLLMTAVYVRELLAMPHLATVTDLGCGDGGLLSLIAVPGSWGYDLSPAAVKAAVTERGVDARLGDIRSPGVAWGDIAVATEVLEHMADPHGLARHIAAHCGALVASSPAFETPEIHYEHHTWAWDTDGYRALIEGAGFRVLRHVITGSAQIISGVRE